MNTSSREERDLRLAEQVRQVVDTTPVFDIHTHLYAPPFGELLLWGIDDLLVYHYLVAEAFRYFEEPYDQFWKRSKSEQADLIWKALFIDHSPISEACRGVLTTLHWLGLDVRRRDLPALRQWFAQWNPDDYITRCMELAGVRRICMTNSPFDDVERPVWEAGAVEDGRFVAALRIDPLLLDWRETGRRLAEWGYAVEEALTEKTVSEVRRFLADWTHRMKPLYLMASFPASFVFPDAGTTAQLIERAVLPHCREFGLPFSPMLGVKRAVNPGLKLAGDGSGAADLSALLNLCAGFPENKFLVTVLARENQHELCVLARKFRNLHIFGCWWFTNVPYLVNEITRLRLEMLGLSMTPQHSDARVLDQIIYKWRHSRAVIADVLTEKYQDLVRTGWEPKSTEIQRDVKTIFGGAFETFCGI